MSKTSQYLIAFILVIIVFHITYGVGSLVPANVNWLMAARHDWGTHYLGWFFYRNEPWHFPLGNITNYYYPVGTNVGFTDSIPLMAIFFKLFNGILPADFQYFGFWLFTCDLLIAWYTLRLTRLFGIRPVIGLLAVILLIANPVLVYRGLHPALCAHWLLIGSIYHYFLDPAKVPKRRILRSQLVLLALSAAINPYLCFMVLGFSIVLPARLHFIDKVSTRKEMAGTILLSIVSLLAIWYVIGLISFGSKEDLNVTGAFGLYSLNLNAFFNSFGFSRFFPKLSWVSWHQYEGYMYPGAGMFVLLISLAIHRITRRPAKFAAPAGATPDYYHGSLLPLSILIILYTLFAVTNVISWNDKVLLRVPLPDLFLKLGETFRASSRFFWPCYYLILLFTIIAVARMNAVRWLAPVLLSLAVFLQFFDCWKLLDMRHFTYGRYTPPLSRDWNRLIAATDKVVLYPPFEASYRTDHDYQDFCFLAAKAGKPVTTGYVARVGSRSNAAYADSLVADLQNSRVSRALYVTTPANLELFANPLLEKKLSLNMLDGYCYLYANQLLKNDAIDSLSDTLNLANASLLDSLRKTVQPIVFREMAAGVNSKELEKGKLVFYFERMLKGRSFLSVSGWGVVENKTTNKGDSICALLISGSKIYAGATKIEKRPDIAARFKADLDDAGFKGVISTNSVDSGEYRIGIGIRDGSGKIVYAVTDSVLRINRTHLVY